MVSPRGPGHDGRGAWVLTSLLRLLIICCVTAALLVLIAAPTLARQTTPEVTEEDGEVTIVWRWYEADVPLIVTVTHTDTGDGPLEIVGLEELSVALHFTIDCGTWEDDGNRYEDCPAHPNVICGIEDADGNVLTYGFGEAGFLKGSWATGSGAGTRLAFTESGDYRLGAAYGSGNEVFSEWISVTVGERSSGVPWLPTLGIGVPAGIAAILLGFGAAGTGPAARLFGRGPATSAPPNTVRIPEGMQAFADAAPPPVESSATAGTETLTSLPPPPPPVDTGLIDIPWIDLGISDGTVGLDYDAAADWLSYASTLLGEFAQQEHVQQWASLFGTATDAASVDLLLSGTGNVPELGGAGTWLAASFDGYAKSVIAKMLADHQAALTAADDKAAAGKDLLDYIGKTLKIGEGGLIEYVDEAGNSVLTTKLAKQEAFRKALAALGEAEQTAGKSLSTFKTLHGAKDIVNASVAALGHVFNMLNFVGDTYANTQDGKYLTDSGEVKAVEGDDFITAAAKGAATTYVSWAVGAANPAVVVAQLAADLLLGQSEGGKIVSPINNIKGIVNFFIDAGKGIAGAVGTSLGSAAGGDPIDATADATGDSVSEATTKLYDGLKSGKYGEAFKHITGGVEETIEFIEDPTLIGEVAANEGLDYGLSGGEDDLSGLVEGIHASIDDVFELDPKAGHWGITKAGTWIAKQTLHGWLEIGEGVSRGASSVGTAIGTWFGGGGRDED